MKKMLLFFAAFIIITPALAQTPDTTRLELPDQRTHFSKTYYNAKDNTYTTTISAGYIHYQASDGAYKDIDTNLRPAGGGAYQITDGLYQVRFAGVAGQKAGYDVDYELPKPVKPKFRDPGKPLAPPTQLRWKILSLGYFDQQSKKYQIIQSVSPVTPVVSGSEISYPQVFTGIDVKYTCQNVRLKEELVLSQTGRNSLPDPTQYGIPHNNAYLMMAVEFALTPANLKVFARRQTGKAPVKQGNTFAFEGDDPIDFEDADSTLHFFFPKDYAWAVNDSATNFAGRTSVKRYFYSDRGKDYMLVGVPYGWITASPSGTLIIDPTTSVATSEDVWLENTSNFDQNSAGLLIGKAADPYPKKRTIIKFNIAGSGISSSATVLNAQMKLYYYSAANGGSGSWVDRWVQAHQILVSWNEAQATSVNRLSGTPWNVAHVGLNDIDAKSTMESTVFFQLGQTGTWKIWNLTGSTQKWVNGTATNNGVVLWATNETTNGYDLRFHSSDAQPPNANPPVLEVTYSTDAATKTVYFLKDHLGSIRATVLDSATAPVIGYDDYDPWGYPLALRTKKTPYDSLQKIAKNKFTGKEWDDEFGVNWVWVDRRPYVPEIARWVVMEPLAQMSLGLSPYVYSLNNPLLFFDPNGAFPYTFHVRAFAPPGAFKGFGFHDDRRGFSTGLDVTSRIKQSFTIDPTAQTYSGGTPTSDPTRIGSFSRTATDKGGISTPEFGTNIFGSATATLTSEFAGSNPLAPFSPDIEVGSAISITENLKEGKVFISLDLSSKQFPATEAFVQDNTGQKLFLAGAAAFGNPTDLINGKKVEVATADLIININNKGVFQNVTFGGKTYSLEEFNKLGTSQSAGPFPR